MASLPSAPERFKNNLGVLFEIFERIIPEANAKGLDTTLLMLALPVGRDKLEKTKSDTIINGFISKSYKYWDKIYTKDTSFFADNATSIFDEAPPVILDIVKTIFTVNAPDGGKYVSEETEIEVWNLLKSLVKISINYVHTQREMRTIQETDKDGNTHTIKKYTKEFYPQLSISKLKEKWSVNISS